ncbi:MAG: carbon starvation protein A [Bacteroidales bacterium]|jgi:carbon starvation protein CstA|nr:carbon starvation protein A [Bacteroidales bacterium]
MITFSISVILLILGYLFYSKIIERIAGARSDRETPAYKLQDNIDYTPLPWWRIFLIQFLNIAGLGPIFGAIAGAMWGPVAFLWIVFGSIFGGAVHDYFSGMLSVKHNGLSITEIIGIYLGKFGKLAMSLFTVFLMVIVGAVFVLGPAGILMNSTSIFSSANTWIAIIFIYYILATLLPINTIIGKIYPVFGFALIFMALGLIIALIVGGYHMPELNTETFQNLHSNKENFPIFPMMFISIACGAISGFHATQSPLMARCIKNETHGRKVFYGAMISEGIVALIWAAIAMSFYGGVHELNTTMSENNGNAAIVVNEIANSLLGTFGAILALFGVVAAPISTGDTAFRGARLIIADFFHISQSTIIKRLLVSIPLFIAGFIFTLIDFGIIWRYFAWANQTLAAVVLWTITVYLVQEKKNFYITFIPALFLTAVILSYIFVAPEGFNLNTSVAYSIGIAASIACGISLLVHRKKQFHSK